MFIGHWISNPVYKHIAHIFFLEKDILNVYLITVVMELVVNFYKQSSISAFVVQLTVTNLVVLSSTSAQSSSSQPRSKVLVGRCSTK